MNTKYMSLAIKEAEKGRHSNWTDPLVGCVIVKGGKVISTGYHKEHGAEHALIMAANKLSPADLVDSTVYLTMEPCDDCANLLINSNCKHVIIAQADPRPGKANKNSTQIVFKSQNVEVTSGIMAQKASLLNQHYSYFWQTGKPWITIKQNLSLDHHVSPANGKYTKLNSVKVRSYIHRERSDYQAIIIGSSTEIIDNPNLFTNNSSFQPIRIVIDRRGRLLNHSGLNVLNNQQYETWILTQNLNTKQFDSFSNIKVFQLKTNKLSEIIDLLSKQGIQSAYVEGGPTLEKAFMDEGYVNEIIDYFSPIYYGNIGLNGAIPVHQLDLGNITVKEIDNHIRVAGIVQ